MVITLGPDLEKALIEESQRHGVTPEAMALRTLQDRFLSEKWPDEPRDEWEQRLRHIATDCGVSLSDAAVSSEGIYE